MRNYTQAACQGRMLWCASVCQRVSNRMSGETSELEARRRDESAWSRRRVGDSEHVTQHVTLHVGSSH